MERQKRGEPIPTTPPTTAAEPPKTFEDYQRMIDQIQFSDEWKKLYQVRDPEMDRLRRVISLSAVLERLPQRLSTFVSRMSWALVAGIVLAFLIVVYGTSLASGWPDFSVTACVFSIIISGVFWAWYGLIAIPRLDDFSKGIDKLASSNTFEAFENSSVSLLTMLERAL